MFTLEELRYLKWFIDPSGGDKPEDIKINAEFMLSKVNLLIEQLQLQEDFRTKALELQKRQQELAKPEQ